MAEEEQPDALSRALSLIRAAEYQAHIRRINADLRDLQMARPLAKGEKADG